MLTSVAAGSAIDIWAVGYYLPNSAWLALAEHWDGTKWSSVYMPSVPGSQTNHLNAVAVVSSKDVWAVGDYSLYAGGGGTLIEHWNGVRWSIVPSPNVAPYALNTLSGVTAVRRAAVMSPMSGPIGDDVWAIGGYWQNNKYGTLVEHWNGTRWTIVPNPNEGSPGDMLDGVAAVSADNIWAVGAYNIPGSTNSTSTLIEHWNGHAWQIVSSPNVGTDDNILNAVAVVNGTDLWAVGQYYDTSKPGYDTLTVNHK